MQVLDFSRAAFAGYAAAPTFLFALAAEGVIGLRKSTKLTQDAPIGTRAEGEAMKAGRRDLKHAAAVQESVRLQQQYRVQWSSQVTASPVDLRGELSSAAGGHWSGRGFSRLGRGLPRLVTPGVLPETVRTRHPL